MLFLHQLKNFISGWKEAICRENDQATNHGASVPRVF
jgi:hypothetical protein